MGAILINPSLQNAYTVASEGVNNYLSIFGIYNIELIGYQGHVIPIVIACFILSVLEKWLHKHVPDMFDLFVTPLVSVFVTAFITIAAVGPIFVYLENASWAASSSCSPCPWASAPPSSVACTPPPS